MQDYASWATGSKTVEELSAQGTLGNDPVLDVWPNISMGPCPSKEASPVHRVDDLRATALAI
jgi:hypothetical protein